MTSATTRPDPWDPKQRIRAGFSNLFSGAMNSFGHMGIGALRALTHIPIPGDKSEPDAPSIRELMRQSLAREDSTLDQYWGPRKGGADNSYSGGARAYATGATVAEVLPTLIQLMMVRNAVKFHDPGPGKLVSTGKEIPEELANRPVTDETTIEDIRKWLEEVNQITVRYEKTPTLNRVISMALNQPATKAAVAGGTAAALAKRRGADTSEILRQTALGLLFGVLQGGFAEATGLPGHTLRNLR